MPAWGYHLCTHRVYPQENPGCKCHGNPSSGDCMRPTFLAPCVPLACLLCGLLSGCELSSTAGPRRMRGLRFRAGSRRAGADCRRAGVFAGGKRRGVHAQCEWLWNASVSLLTNVPGSTTLDSSGGATDGDYYATTVAGGTFSITGDYTCTPGSRCICMRWAGILVCLWGRPIRRRACWRCWGAVRARGRNQQLLIVVVRGDG